LREAADSYIIRLIRQKGTAKTQMGVLVIPKSCYYVFEEKRWPPRHWLLMRKK
jgi:hypothetical protein